MEETLQTEGASSNNSISQTNLIEDEASAETPAQTNFRSMLAGQHPSQIFLGGDQQKNSSAESQMPSEDERYGLNHGNSPRFQTVPKIQASGKSKATKVSNTSLAGSGSYRIPSSAQPKKSMKSSLPDPFIQIRKHADKKVVGLKDCGSTTREIRKNEWLSSTSSLQSDPNLILAQTKIGGIPDTIPDTIPAMAGTGVSFPSYSVRDLAQSPAKDSPSLDLRPPMKPKSVEELEERARRKALMNPFELLFLGNIAALKVMGFYLITVETFMTCGLTVGLTMYWYNSNIDNSSWSGGGLDFVLLAFAVTSPISAAIAMAFQRRERALIAIADFRSFSYHLFLAHCLWDWPDGKEMGREKAEGVNRVNWLEHCDAVLAQLLGIGDELSRFLTLPTASRSRHRMTKKGRREAARTMEVAYQLVESMTTQRMTRLIYYSERLKKIGLPSGEVSRIRQYERFLSDTLEQLRIVKLYRTPQALRSFGRVFTILLPPFYAPVYAQVARETQSLEVGIAFGIITALALTALFESMEVLEDPFTAFLALDGIDVREEFEVLHFSQLTVTRKLIFPDAPEYPAGRRAALTRRNHPGRKLHTVGMPPMQPFHSVASVGTHHAALSVHSGITMDGTNHYVPVPVTVPVSTGDDDMATTVAGTSPYYADLATEHADEELGIALPVNEITNDHKRVSVFDEDRAFFGVTDDEDDASHHLRRRFRGSISPSDTGTNQNDTTSCHTPPPTPGDGLANSPHHRRTSTGLSAARFLSPKSKMRLPDV